MAYVDTHTSNHRIATLTSVALIHVAAGFALVNGLAASFIPQAREILRTFDIAPPKPKPVPTPTEPPAAQDPLSVFEKGSLRVEEAPGGLVLRYRLVSRFMLFCFILPLVFVGFGQLTLAVAEYQKAQAEAKEKAEGAKKDEKKKDEPVLTLNPVDKFLGAPAPEKPKDGEGKSRKRKPSATAAYVFAGIFAFLYLVGRFLEPWLVRRTFRRKLMGEG